MTEQKIWNPIDFFFSWTTDGWYEWDFRTAQQQALRLRNQYAKLMRKEGLHVKCFTLRNQLVTRGGIGSGHPEISACVNCYGVNVW